MKKYKDLNLKEIMKKADLDFAHFTYGKGQCSCCYGPWDMPKRYWKNGIKLSRYLEGTQHFNERGEECGGVPREISYILFKNAYNGSGTVTKEDTIEDYTCIGYKLSKEQLDIVCEELQNQLGSEYIVTKPENEHTCIVIHIKED